MGSFRILVVDPDRSTSRSISETLEPQGYEIKAAFNAKLALQILEEWAPDVTILEPDLPETDGYELVRSLRTNSETAILPVIFLADRRTVQERLEGFHIGADDFVEKPIPLDELDLRITACVKKREETERRVRRQKTASKEWSVDITGIRGNLEQIGLPSLLSVLEMENRTGLLVLIIDSLKEKARIEFRRGRPLRAWLDKDETPRNSELIYRLVGRTKGKFDFRPQAIESDDEIGSPITSLLLEGARRMDETKRRSTK